MLLSDVVVFEGPGVADVLVVAVVPSSPLLSAEEDEGDEEDEDEEDMEVVVQDILEKAVNLEKGKKTRKRKTDEQIDFFKFGISTSFGN